MAFLDYYEILSVPPTASHEQIERAYRRLVTISHPDLFPNDPKAQAWANERMKQINEAYDVLRDSGKRATYARTSAQQKTASGRGEQQQQRQQDDQRRERREPRVPCPLCEQRRRVPCLTCQGRGDTTCPGCHGERMIVCPLCGGIGTLTEAEFREVYAAWERAQQQAQAEAARQEAEAAARLREAEARQERETRRRAAMAGVGLLCLLFVARSCATDAGRPVASSPGRAPVVPPTPYQPSVPPVPQPPQATATPSLPSLRSMNSDVATEITFRNETSNPVQVWWIDYNGQEVFYRTLAPSESYVQSTYATHPWRLRDAVTGRTLRTMVARSTPSQVVVGQQRRTPSVAKQVPPPAAAPTVPDPSVTSPNDQAQGDAPKVPLPEPSQPLVQSSPIPRSLTDLSPILRWQTEFRYGGTLLGQPYRFAVIHTNRAGLIMRTIYALDGQYDRFEVTVWMDGSGNVLQQAVAKVYGDGQLLFESPGLGMGQAPVKVSVSVKGVTKLELQTTGLPVVMTIVWADPRLIKEQP